MARASSPRTAIPTSRYGDARKIKLEEGSKCREPECDARVKPGEKSSYCKLHR